MASTVLTSLTIYCWYHGIHSIDLVLQYHWLWQLLPPIFQSSIWTAICDLWRKHFCKISYYMQTMLNKANLRDLIAVTGWVILRKQDLNPQFFYPYDLEILRMTLKNNRAPLLCTSSFVKPLVYSNWSYRPETPNSGKNWQFFCPVWPWNLTDHLEKQ